MNVGDKVRCINARRRVDDPESSRKNDNLTLNKVYVVQAVFTHPHENANEEYITILDDTGQALNYFKSRFVLESAERAEVYMPASLEFVNQALKVLLNVPNEQLSEVINWLNEEKSRRAGKTIGNLIERRIEV